MRVSIAMTIAGLTLANVVSATEASSAAKPGRPRKSHGRDNRPELTSPRAKANSGASASTPSRSCRSTAVFGVMKVVVRLEFRMFSSAPCTRSR